jgi:hypothetical protein
MWFEGVITNNTANQNSKNKTLKSMELGQVWMDSSNISRVVVLLNMGGSVFMLEQLNWHTPFRTVQVFTKSNIAC